MNEKRSFRECETVEKTEKYEFFIYTFGYFIMRLNDAAMIKIYIAGPIALRKMKIEF